VRAASERKSKGGDGGGGGGGAGAGAGGAKNKLAREVEPYCLLLLLLLLLVDERPLFASRRVDGRNGTTSSRVVLWRVGLKRDPRRPERRE
jgi:hypothetical protein